MAKLDGTNGLIQQYDYQVLTTGFSYTFAAGTQTLVINPAGTLATGTITMPAAPADGMVITFESTQAITALTVQGNTGQSFVGAPARIYPNQPESFVYRLSNTTWYPYSVGRSAVLQVVQGTYSTEANSSSSTYADTGLTASITPSSSTSKILVVVSQDIGKATNDLSAQLQLVRNTTSLGLITNVYTASSATFYSVNSGFTYLDSPATTSSTTYKTQFRSSNGLASARTCANNALATITLMEIAG